MHLAALGDKTGVIRGSQPAAAGLSNVWQALHDSLEAIPRRAVGPSKPVTELGPDSLGQPGTEAG